MNCAFLGKMIPDEMSDSVSENSKRNMQDAANALQWHLYDGLCRNLNSGIYIINVLPIGSFPQYHKKAIIKRCFFKTEFQNKNINIGFLNLKLIKNYFIRRNVEKALKKWCRESEENRTVFVYSMLLSFLKAIENVKKKYPSLKVCTVIADLPNMTSLSSADNRLVKHFRNLLSDSCYSKIDEIDSFVLLTEQMADYMKIKQPYCIVEGIATKTEEQLNFDFLSSPKKTIMYAGTLHKRFGILNLVEAFKMIKGDEYRLCLCGIGDAEEEIIKAASEDGRIEFLGQKTRAEVLKLQQKAYVLVNPRQNIEEFTKYSFPSKNIESLSSGHPLVAYKLDGIPDEYDEHIFYVNDNSVEALAQKITEVCEMPQDLLKKHCSEAYSFVQTEKNEVKQTEKIIDMLKRVGMLR